MTLDDMPDLTVSVLIPDNSMCWLCKKPISDTSKVMVELLMVDTFTHGEDRVNFHLECEQYLMWVLGRVQIA